MIGIDLGGASVVVTGGTRGLGKAVGMEFARAGATVFLTHRWGSVAEADLLAEFAASGLPRPQVVESDASDAKAVRELMALVKERGGRLDVVVSNVAFAKIVNGLPDLKKSSLDLSLAYSAWPVVEYVQAARETLGRYPRYVLGISSDGPDVCHPGYDLAGASKAVLETLCRYLALRLRPEGVRVNAVRPGLLDTQSSRATAGDAAIDAVKRRAPGVVQDPRGVARACLALCSGLMDSVTGQVLVVDEGWSLVDPLAFLTGAAVPPPFPRRGWRPVSAPFPDEVAALLRTAEKGRLAPPGGTAVLMDRAAIEALVPHRGEALLLDRVTALDPVGGTVVARYDLARAASLLSGHFPGHPVWPGAWQVEAIGQAGLVLVLATAPPSERPAAVSLTGILGARFLLPVRPPADVEIVARVMEDGLFRIVVGQCLVDGAVCSVAALKGT